MAFCDFCECDDCREGPKGSIAKSITHAKTSDGRWICDICYLYDECKRQRRVEGDTSKYGSPCEDKNCKHRPKLVGPWE